ncbi:CIS tube protein [Cellulomonas chitinilytica]|uniref:CIS tube protein n=1 Tax=Cellulomonas chitinilytica TaxID=398759 RepID=UPI001EF211A3|nr:LysM peptidoglycan-binding domain-containing protein [Cellulomonas chitinilytica]
MSPSPVGFSAAGASKGGGSLVHASLKMNEPSTDGALDKAGPSLGEIAFQFNPKELALTKTVSWTRPTTKGTNRASPPQFQGPQPSKLTIEMFFDASDTHDDSVVKNVEKLFECCVPTPTSLAAKKASPPWVQFRWGGLTSFLAYVSTVSAKYTLFTAEGLPIRATCSVTLEELAGAPPKTNPTSGGQAPHREHVLVSGDTLPAIAYREYGDPGLWRAVAAANGIDDPTRLRPGGRLLLPAQSDLLHDPGRRSGPVEQAPPSTPSGPVEQPTAGLPARTLEVADAVR